MRSWEACTRSKAGSSGRQTSADYIATTMNYHTIIISHIPPMSMKIRDKARAIRRPYMLSYLIH
uniref:Uncharacterized protein n=1 Tax=Aegilops tauschii subsp. strangulata TaxID=200361 RepID=A0A453IED4_AEGTS